MIPPADTLPARLRAAARLHPDRVAFTYLAEGEEPTDALTYADLDARATAVAGWLARRFPPGERVLLALPSDLRLLVGFFGCLYAGAVAVPVPPPRPRRDSGRFLAVAASARPAVVLTTTEVLARLLPGAAGLSVVTLDDVLDAADPADLPAVDPDGLAFLQYTSGSTADPRGVCVRHGHMTANEEAIRRAFGHGPDTVVVGWLPLHHDMGLIGNALQTVYLGAKAVLMPPAAFLQQPVRWLRAIDRYGATTAGGPNFGYDLCVRRVPPDDRRGLNLSRWRVAFNGAEPVSAATLVSFADAFAPSGFDPAAFFPCYGLAEATLFVTGPSAGTGYRALRVSRQALTAGRVRLAADSDPDGVPVVGCGRAAAGLTVTVTDPETGNPAAADRVGEVCVTGASVADGYWDHPAATADTFRPPAPALRTGDLGFLAADELYITGRSKDVVIVRGLKFHPEDIEQTVGNCHPHVAGCRGAVVSLAAGGDGVTVVHEVAPRTPAAELPQVAAAVLAAVTGTYGITHVEVVLLKAGYLPVTTSGKPRRAVTKISWQSDSLKGVQYIDQTHGRN